MSVARTITVTVEIEGDADTIADVIAESIREDWRYKDFNGDGETKDVTVAWSR